MKAICLLSLMISYTALTDGTAYAHPANPTSQQTSPESPTAKGSNRPQDAEHAAPANGGKGQKGGSYAAGRRDNRQVSAKNHPRSSAAIRNDRSKHPLNDRERSPSGNAMNGLQPGSYKSSVVAPRAMIHGDTVNSALPVRPARVIRPAFPLPNNVHHHGANPAVIGGSANSSSRSTGAIDGTDVHRRP